MTKIITNALLNANHSNAGDGGNGDVTSSGGQASCDVDEFQRQPKMLHQENEGKSRALCGQAAQQPGDERSGNVRNVQGHVNKPALRVAWSAKPPVFTAEEAKLRYLLENGLCDPGSIAHCTGRVGAL